MKTIGIFEAKTKLTSLCDEVGRSGEPLLIQKRGRPLAVLSRAEPEESSDRSDILSAWEAWQAEHPDSGDEFPEVWKMRSAPKSDPLAP